MTGLWLQCITTCLQFGGDSSGYSVSGGLHGVGISVVNALSQELHVSVFRRGRRYSQRYSQGVPMTPLVDEPDQERRVGTAVSFLYDSTIFAKRYVGMLGNNWLVTSHYKCAIPPQQPPLILSVQHLIPTPLLHDCASWPFYIQLQPSTCESPKTVPLCRPRSLQQQLPNSQVGCHQLSLVPSTMLHHRSRWLAGVPCHGRAARIREMAQP